MVVGIEPFGHLAGCDTAAAVGMLIGRLGRTPTRHAEVVVQRIPVKAAHALRKIAERETHVQHLIVKGEVADRHEIQRCLILPMPAAKLGTQCLQFVTRRLPFPIGFESEFQFALGANARKAEVVRECHGV